MRENVIVMLRLDERVKAVVALIADSIRKQLPYIQFAPGLASLAEHHVAIYVAKEYTGADIRPCGPDTWRIEAATVKIWDKAVTLRRLIFPNIIEEDFSTLPEEELWQ